MAILAQNPANGQVIAEYPETPQVEVEAAIRRAQEAHEAWKTTTYPHRAELMMNAAAILRARARESS